LKRTELTFYFLGVYMSPFVLPVSDWSTPASKIPRQHSGGWRIIKRKIRPFIVYPMNRVLGYDYYFHTSDAVYTTLQERAKSGYKTWMIDSPVEWYGFGEFMLRTKGPNVLVAGLGLGLIVHHLVMRRDIERICVVEISKEVISMVKPYLPKDRRVQIINEDFFKAVPKLAEMDRTFQTIIVDVISGKKESAENKEIIENARMIIEDYYLDAQQLFWGFHYDMDNEASFYMLHRIMSRRRRKREGTT